MTVRSHVAKGALAVTLVLAVGVCWSAAHAQGKAKPALKDIPLEVSVLPTTGSALYMDKASPYTNGVDGVFNTLLHITGTNDATMGLNGSQRNLGLVFPDPLQGSAVPENYEEFLNVRAATWTTGAAGSVYWAQPFMNVYNILWGRMNGKSTFTTKILFIYLNGAYDTTGRRYSGIPNYFLRFAGPMNDTGMPDPDSSWPYWTTPVTVQDVPGTCRQQQGGTLDSWIVTVGEGSVDRTTGEPGPAAVGALMRTATSTSPSGQVAQFSMPFQLKITAKSCLPF